MLVCWANETNDSSTKCLTFQVFFFIISYRLRALKTLYFHFCNSIKKKNWKGFCKELQKKIMLGTSDAWSMSHLSHWPSEPAYYIEDCRICSNWSMFLFSQCSYGLLAIPMVSNVHYIGSRNTVIHFRIISMDECGFAIFEKC